jgi:hypothetical protein
LLPPLDKRFVSDKNTLAIFSKELTQHEKKSLLFFPPPKVKPGASGRNIDNRFYRRGKLGFGSRSDNFIQNMENMNLFVNENE